MADNEMNNEMIVKSVDRIIFVEMTMLVVVALLKQINLASSIPRNRRKHRKLRK